MAAEPTDNLFTEHDSEIASAEKNADKNSSPLPHRLAPRNFYEFVGQEESIGPDTPLRKALEADRLTSLIIYGPPGCGKTALANIITQKTEAAFETLNAVLAGKDDLREVIDRARQRLRAQNKRTVLFFDEIHRFNKAQQDALLPSVERGLLILVGATTQNPYFYLNNALLSRSLLVEFEPLSKGNLEKILDRALSEEQGLRENITLTEKAREHLINSANGDARRLLNGLEIAARTTDSPPVELEEIENVFQEQYVQYDREGDHHYDVASAFIKSIRGSDPDAAIYYLAKMLEAGEEPRFIARRLIIAAAEDIGNAAPFGLNLAVTAMEAVEYVGMPEAQIPLAQATTYLAASPKSNAAYLAINQARNAVKEGLDLPVPAHLRDSSYGSEEAKEASGDYKYPHNFKNHYTPQQYLAEPQTFYQPTNQGQEARLKKYLHEISRQNNKSKQED